MGHFWDTLRDTLRDTFDKWDTFETENSQDFLRFLRLFGRKCPVCPKSVLLASGALLGVLVVNGTLLLFLLMNLKKYKKYIYTVYTAYGPIFFKSVPLDS